MLKEAQVSGSVLQMKNGDNVYYVRKHCSRCLAECPFVRPLVPLVNSKVNQRPMAGLRHFVNSPGS
ncbi:hypothetical protein A2379_04030 [Candidatus Amesbacteria bacterium RIFOXYB1_FULL_47_13]|nr:MAG: hypothetical protein A2379_04030 [Candidatus Amesbacteria bacterium RIFOXYB1_FULL_47_13]